jgi:hypothetical protein
MDSDDRGGDRDRERDRDRDRDRDEVMRAVRYAGEEWAGAMRAHKLAPPDPGFASRIRQLAEAAAREQAAWEHAHAAGLMWRPVPGAENAQPPYELRPGTGRRGPDDLWGRFDRAVAALNRAITGSDAAAVADAFGELSQTAVTLAEAVEREDAAREGEDRAREPHGTEAQEHERRVRSRGAA